MLTQYPILSVELMHLDVLARKLDNPAQLERLTRDLMLRLETQLTSQKAIIESIHNNILFFSLRDGDSMRDALARALKAGVALTRKPIPVHGIDLRLRVGLDVIAGPDRNPVAAVPERMVAQPGQLVVSPEVREMTIPHLAYEAVGPIKVQGALRTFFRLVPESAETQAAPPVAPPQELAQAPATAPPAPVRPQPAMAPEQPEPQSDPQPLAAQQPPTAEPRREAPPPPMETALPDEASIPRRMEPQEHPGSIHYEPPGFVVKSGMPKPPNILYAHAMEAFEADISQYFGLSRAQQGQVIAIAAEESMGKSALIGMTLSKFPAEAFTWLGGGFFEQTSHNEYPFSYWVELVQNRFGLPPEGVAVSQGEDYLNRMLQEVYGGSMSEMTQDFMRTLLSFNPVQPVDPDVRGMLGRMIPEFQNFLSAMAQDRPLVLVMEDLDYHDAASLELLVQLLQRDLLRLPIVVVLTYSPNLLPAGPLEEALNRLPFKEYVLERVGEEALAEIAQPPLAVPWKKLPDTLRAQLMEKGSPMYLEEAFRWLLLQKGFSIHSKTGKFSPEKALKKLVVPESLAEILQDRYAALDDMSRSVLQIASVLGERFSTDVLANMTPLADRLEEVLQFLWQNGFIVPDSGSLIRFRHRLIWQAAYGSIEPEARRKQHQLVADYFERARAVGVAVNPAIIARHQLLAGNTPPAMVLYNQVGGWLAHVGSVTGANLAFRHIQAMMAGGADKQQQARLYETLALLNLDIYPDYAKNLLLTAMEMKQHEGPEVLIQLQLFLAQAYEHLGVYNQLTSTLWRVLDSLPPGGEGIERVAIGSQLVWFLYVQGNLAESAQVYRQVVSQPLARAGDVAWADPDLRQSIIRGEIARARTAIMRCDSQAIEIIENALLQCDIHDEPAMAMQLRLTRCLVFLFRGDLETCQRDLQPILGAIEQMPDNAPLMTWWGITVLMLHMLMEDWNNAAMLLPNTAYQAEQARDYLAWCLCQSMAGGISMGSDNRAEAQRLLEQAVTISAEYQLSEPALLGWNMITENEIGLGHLDTADQVCNRALEVAQKPHIGNTVAFYRLILSQAKILLARRAYKSAGTLLEQHWPAMVQSGYLPLVAEAAYQIAELYGLMARDLPEPHHSKYMAQRQNFLDKARTVWQNQGNHRRLARADANNAQAMTAQAS